MGVAVITGSTGLVGSEAARHFARLGMDIVGIDNDMRATFFGAEAPTAWQRGRLEPALGRQYRHNDCDIRDAAAIDRIIGAHGRRVALVIHTAVALCMLSRTCLPS